MRIGFQTERTESKVNRSNRGYGRILPSYRQSINFIWPLQRMDSQPAIWLNSVPTKREVTNKLRIKTVQDKSNPTPIKALINWINTILKKHPQNQKWYSNFIQGHWHPIANKRQYSTTHSSGFMFPAAVENVILDKWASEWLWD